MSTKYVKPDWRFHNLQSVVMITAGNVGRRCYEQFQEDWRLGKRELDEDYAESVTQFLYGRVMEDRAVAYAVREAKDVPGFKEFWEELTGSLLTWAGKTPRDFWNRVAEDNQ